MVSIGFGHRTDMFLVGMALLTSGMSLYVMFIAPDKMKQGRGRPVAAASNSNLFGLFNFEVRKNRIVAF